MCQNAKAVQTAVPGLTFSLADADGVRRGEYLRSSRHSAREHLRRYLSSRRNAQMQLRRALHRSATSSTEMTSRRRLRPPSLERRRSWRRRLIQPPRRPPGARDAAREYPGHGHRHGAFS